MTTESKAQVAKTALSRMKLVAKTLGAISSSVEEMIELVTSESSSFILTADFNSLPDDVLARIFELCASWGEYDGGFVTNYVPSRLSSVCRRFRHIALRLPCLWANVSNYHKDEWALLLKNRCLKPNVFVVTLFEEDSNGWDNLFRILQPANQWKGLDVDVHYLDLHDVLELVSERSGGDFSGMESLKIGPVLENNEWYEQYEPPTTNLSDSDDALISSWRLPSLRALTVQNVIPSTIHCPNLRSCKIILSTICRLCIWDLRALKTFLHTVRHVESLSLELDGADCSHIAQSSVPIKFPRLRSLAIEAKCRTKPKVLRYVMDAVEAETLSTLDISLERESISDQSHKYSDWLTALFTSSTGRPRTFASVKTFKLRLKPDDKGDDFPDKRTLLALPHVQNLYLNLPANLTANLYHIFGTVKDLHTLRLENCPRYADVRSLEAYIRSRAREKNDEFASIEEVELRGFSPLSFHTKEIEKLLGKKFIQGGSNSSPPS